jgi:hypothetical protein
MGTGRDVNEPHLGRRVLRCDECGSERVCRTAELLQYTRDGWPHCCGQVMGLYTDPERPDDTAAEVPALPPP